MSDVHEARPFLPVVGAVPQSPVKSPAFFASTLSRPPRDNTTMVFRYLLFFLALGTLVHASEWYPSLHEPRVCLLLAKGSSVQISMTGRFLLSGGFAEANLHIIFFDSKLAHFEHYSEQQLEQYSSMKNTIAVNKDGWGVQVDKADYEPEVFTFSSDKYRHYPQNITRTGIYCYLGLLNGVKNATDSEKRNFMFGFSINEINSSLPRSQIISIITFVARTFYSLSVSLIVWHLCLPKIIFWRELASFFAYFIVLVQVLRHRSSIGAGNMRSCFNVSLLALYFKPDNIVTPLILGLSLLQAILFDEEQYFHICMVDTVIFTIFLTVNLLFVKKAWDNRSKLGVLVQLERLWILLERFFVSHTFPVLMRFLSQSSFYKKYALYEETFSINGFVIEYQTYYVLLKLLVIGGGLYCAKPQASHTKRYKRASNAQVLLMLALFVASVFLLTSVFFPVLHPHECVRHNNFSPRGYLTVDAFIPETDPSFEKGFIYAQQRF
jgi:hypothetical protein